MKIKTTIIIMILGTNACSAKKSPRSCVNAIRNQHYRLEEIIEQFKNNENLASINNLSTGEVYYQDDQKENRRCIMMLVKEESTEKLYALLPRHCYAPAFNTNYTGKVKINVKENDHAISSEVSIVFEPSIWDEKTKYNLNTPKTSDANVVQKFKTLFGWKYPSSFEGLNSCLLINETAIKDMPNTNINCFAFSEIAVVAVKDNKYKDSVPIFPKERLQILKNLHYLSAIYDTLQSLSDCDNDSGTECQFSVYDFNKESKKRYRLEYPVVLKLDKNESLLPAFQNNGQILIAYYVSQLSLEYQGILSLPYKDFSSMGIQEVLGKLSALMRQIESVLLPKESATDFAIITSIENQILPLSLFKAPLQTNPKPELTTDNNFIRLFFHKSLRSIVVFLNDDSPFKLEPGDSGSILIGQGMPLAFLSTVDNLPYSGGIAFAHLPPTPKDKAVIIAVTPQDPPQTSYTGSSFGNTSSPRNNDLKNPELSTGQTLPLPQEVPLPEQPRQPNVPSNQEAIRLFKETVNQIPPNSSATCL